MSKNKNITRQEQFIKRISEHVIPSTDKNLNLTDNNLNLYELELKTFHNKTYSYVIGEIKNKKTN